ADDEAAARRQPARRRDAVVLDPPAQLEVARRALLARRRRRTTDTEVWRRPRDEVERRRWQQRRVAQVAEHDVTPAGGIVPGERAPCERDARLLGLDADGARRRKAPGKQHQDGADAAAEVENRPRRRLLDDTGGEPRRHEVVERPAVPVESLQDPPVAGEIAEVLARTRPPHAGRAGRPRPRCAPAVGTARAANDSGVPQAGCSRAAAARATAMTTSIGSNGFAKCASETGGPAAPVPPHRSAADRAAGEP